MRINSSDDTLNLSPGTTSSSKIGISSPILRLADYFGLPLIDQGSTVIQGQNVSAMPFRAYQLIYQEYFQDQNLNAELDISLASQTVDSAEQDKIMTMRKRAWEKDYFTSALPWAQRGGAASLPSEVNYKPQSTVHESDGTLTNTVGSVDHNALGNLTVESSGGLTGRIENIDSVEIDINDLRKSVRLQEWA